MGREITSPLPPHRGAAGARDTTTRHAHAHAFGFTILFIFEDYAEN